MGGLLAVAVREGDAQASVAGEDGGEGIVGGGAGGEVHGGGAVLAGRALDEGEQRGGEYLVGGLLGGDVQQRLGEAGVAEEHAGLALELGVPGGGLDHGGEPQAGGEALGPPRRRHVGVRRHALRGLEERAGSLGGAEVEKSREAREPRGRAGVSVRDGHRLAVGRGGSARDTKRRSDGGARGRVCP